MKNIKTLGNFVMAIIFTINLSVVYYQYVFEQKQPTAITVLNLVVLLIYLEATDIKNKIQNNR